MGDMEEISELMTTVGSSMSKGETVSPRKVLESADSIDSESEKSGTNPSRWARNGKTHWGVQDSTPSLECGMYTGGMSDTIGAYLTKVTNATDGLIHLPDSASDSVLREIDEFADLKPEFVARKMIYKRGIFLWGPPGSGKCLVKGTPVLMFDGTVKCVEDVKIGDVLMGDDSTPRNVLSLARGQEELYAVHQKNGDTYGVNESHILSLVRDTWKKGRYNPHHKSIDYVDVSVKDYLQKTANFKKEYFGYKVAVDFTESAVTVDPYYLGIWLGDGTSSSPSSVTTADPEVVSFLSSYASKLGLDFVRRNSLTSGKADTYSLSGTAFKEGSNPILTWFKELNLVNNKHIPMLYKCNNRSIRLELLAGLLDSDGYQGSNCFEFSNTNTNLVLDVVYLARSLGFKVTVANKQSTNEDGAVFDSQSVHISGHTNQIPTRIARKQCSPRKQKKNPLHTSIKLEPLGLGNYFGFEIDGNRRFVLGDFTVTHNTSTLAQLVDIVINKMQGIAFVVEHPGQAAGCLKLIRQIEPNRQIVALLEDMDALIDSYGEARYLSILDGENQVDNIIFVATTNYPERMDKRFIDRPSRFDSVIKVGMPSAKARAIYLAAKEPELTPAQIDQYVDLSDGFSIAHLREFIILTRVFKRDIIWAAKKLRAMMGKQPSSTSSEGAEFGFTASKSDDSKQVAEMPAKSFRP